MKFKAFIREFFAAVALLLSIPLIILLSPFIVFYLIYQVSIFGRG